jgi:type IV pilus assembly protein PilC
MIFSARLPCASEIEMCRSLRHYLSAGLSLVDTFRMLAKGGSPPLRPCAQHVLRYLEQGDDLATALQSEERRFSPLLLGMAKVGEQSGNLAEIFGELEKYFRMQQRLRRRFWGQAVWPLFQLGAAILVIAGLIFLLGVLPGKTLDGKTPDPLGLGLTGPSGAMIFLVIVAVVLGALAGTYIFLSRVLSKKSMMDRFFLRVPVLGPCLEALAMSRFCLALRLTLDSSLPITRALRLSLRATDNAAYLTSEDDIVAGLKSGDTLSETLARTRLFPWDFQQIVSVGEESGQLPESMERQAKNYQELAEHRLALLTQAASWGVWLVVAVVIIVVIFRIFTGFILPMYNV